MDIFLPSKRRWAGSIAEAHVLLFYQQQGYRLLVQNGHVGRAEVDLLLWHPFEKSLLVIEVKYQKQGFEGWEIPERQARRVFRAARMLRPASLMTHQPELRLCLVSGCLKYPHIQEVRNILEGWG